jgi:hypothetical protein
LSRLKSEKGGYIAAGEETGFAIEELPVNKLNPEFVRHESLRRAECRGPSRLTPFHAGFAG